MKTKKKKKKKSYMTKNRLHLEIKGSLDIQKIYS